MSRKQRTLAAPARVSGIGYWSDQDVEVHFLPSGVDSGIAFVRSDLPRAPRIPVNLDNRVETPRRTTLRFGAARVEMIEHIMAALAGLQIDNCEIRVNAQEMPGCDGSSEPFVEALDRAGAVTQEATRPVLRIRKVVRLGEGDSWIEARPVRTGGLSIKYHLDYGANTAIGRQELSLPITPDSFRRELARSRTFVLKSEADWLISQGLGARASMRDLLIFGPKGPIDNELRYPDECVRHKALDLVGDLALAGCDLEGHFVAHRSGHRLNAELVRALLAESAPSVEQRRIA